MATFHFHFPPPPDELHFDAAPVCPEHPGAADLREYWQAHAHDVPAVKPERDVVANVRRAASARQKAQDQEFNDKTLLVWQHVKRDGLTISAACVLVGISEGTYRKRARRLIPEIDAVQ